MVTNDGNGDEGPAGRSPNVDGQVIDWARWAMWASIPAITLAVTPIVKLWTEHAPTANFTYFDTPAAFLVPFLLIMQLGFGAFHQLGNEHFKSLRSCGLITAALGGVLVAMALGSILGRVSLLDLGLLQGDLFHDSCVDFLFVALFDMSFCVVALHLFAGILHHHGIQVRWINGTRDEAGDSDSALLL